MLGLKQAIDKQFFYNWNETPIHFDGTKFTDATSRYIRLKSYPLSSSITSINNASNREEMALEIYAYSNSQNDVLFLLDEALLMINNPIGFKTRVNAVGEVLTLDTDLFYGKITVTAYENKIIRSIQDLVDSYGVLLVDANQIQLVG